ncbi:hypothetical protein [Brevundimonas sp.]|uniref:hypothetical protein n=1 Tax=Brevundimonas sp. TaxID=1871086 RepID=UPI003D11054A
MVEKANWRVAAAMLLGVCAATGCSAAAIALAWPETRIAGWMGLAPFFEARASRNAAGAADHPHMARLARVETMASLGQAAANPTAWLRLAYLDSLEPSGLGEAGNRALAASYAVSRYGPDDTPWRLSFAFNHWARLDRSNRLLVLEELRATPYPYSPGDLQNSVSDPAGRLALALTLETIRQTRENGRAEWP